MELNVVKDELKERLGMEVEKFKRLGAGSFGVVYKAIAENFSVVVKIYKVDGLAEKEATQLSILREHCRVKIPEVYFWAPKSEKLEADILCMEYIDGKDAFLQFSLLFKSKKLKRQFAERVVEAMLDIHSCTSEKFGDIVSPQYDDWREYYLPFCRDVFERLENMRKTRRVPRYIYNAAQRGFGMFNEIFEQKVERASLIHGDLNVMNMLVKPPFELVGIIDPLNAMFADREYDLFQLNNLTGKAYGLYKLYKQSYPVSEYCDVKCAFYALFNEIFCFVNTGRYSGTIMIPIVMRANKEFAKFAESRKK